MFDILFINEIEVFNQFHFTFSVHYICFPVQWSHPWKGTVNLRFQKRLLCQILSRCLWSGSSPCLAAINLRDRSHIKSAQPQHRPPRRPPKFPILKGIKQTCFRPRQSSFLLCRKYESRSIRRMYVQSDSFFKWAIAGLFFVYIRLFKDTI